MCSNYLKNIRVEYSDTLTSLFNPGCSGFEDKPFGSEMCYGRGVCDTDPIQKYNIIKSCLTQDTKSIDTAVISIEDIESQGYSVEAQKPSLVPEQRTVERDNEIRKQFQKVLVSLFQDPRKGHQNFCEEVRKTIKRILAKEPCDECSSEGSSIPKTPYPSIASVYSPMEQDYLHHDSKASYNDPLKAELRIRNIKPVGPFTEPLNPGNQMKLGEPYHGPNSLKKNFYDDF